MPQAKHSIRVLESRKWVEVKFTGQADNNWEVRLAPRGLEEAIRLETPVLSRWAKDPETRKTLMNMVLGALISGFVGYLFHLLQK